MKGEDSSSGSNWKTLKDKPKEGAPDVEETWFRCAVCSVVGITP